MRSVKFLNGLNVFLYLVPVFVFIGFVLYFSWGSATGRVTKTIQETKANFDSLASLSSNYESVLRQNFANKYSFINLSGAAAKLVSLNTYNKVQKLGNGFLTDVPEGKKDFSLTIKQIAEMSNFLKQKGIPFLYLAAPDKRAIYDAKHLPGYVDRSRENYKSFVEGLKKAGVDVLDMDSLFKEANLGTESLFFRTDHHWNIKAAQFAAQKTMEHLHSEGLADYKEEWLTDSAYDIQNLPNVFLGSHGNRVGVHYGGLDDIPVYSSLFPTEYTYAGLSNKTYTWTYTDSPQDKGKIRKFSKPLKGKELFGQVPYQIYMYTRLPLQYLENSKAPNAKKVLVLGDSFRMPWQYFVSSQFQKMEDIEMTMYKEGSVAQYIAQRKPDLVVMVLNSSMFNEPKYSDFGVSAYRKEIAKSGKGTKVLPLNDLILEAKGNQKDKFEILPTSKIQAGITYTVSVASTKLEKSGDKYIQMTLQNLTTNRPEANRYFEANSTEQQKWIFTVPNKPGDTYALYVYAGIKGNTRNARAEIEGITMQEGIGTT